MTNFHPLSPLLPSPPFQDYPVVLIVPDMFQKGDLKFLTNILLLELQFPCICLQKESVCSSVAANKLTSCVVDVGHTKTSVSCVHGGQVIPGTSFHLLYGGDNITGFLLKLLKSQREANNAGTQETDSPQNECLLKFGGHYFPFMFCNLRNMRDYQVINNLKENSCNFNKKVQLLVRNFSLYSDHRPTGSMYFMNVSTVLWIAPAILFYPDLLKWVSLDYSANFHPEKGRQKYVKGKFLSPVDVSWHTIHESCSDMDTIHVPTPGTTLYDDYLGVEYVNQYQISGEQWVTDEIQIFKHNEVHVTESLHSKNPSKKRRTKEPVDTQPKDDQSNFGKTQPTTTTTSTKTMEKAGNVVTEEALECSDMDEDCKDFYKNNKRKRMEKQHLNYSGDEGDYPQVRDQRHSTKSEVKNKTHDYLIKLKIPHKFLDRRKSVSLSQVIIESIEQVDDKKLRHEIYENILLTGGTSLISGLKSYLEERYFPSFFFPNFTCVV
eukprot:TRINITY_DN5765_c0_g1_i6.p1 TRINITY_DN5765_c0_g1~~TRINITY_DN5765_c0_g1_i6.p1  ORF type:complete len:492 (-),score=104.05 TRINITY_DN5765_c0_g1_i6:139-1614(-)